MSQVFPQDPMNDGANALKQSNFLQKLYDFLSLDPHPCPEVIYWAADSKQLVIAQPDRLVKEVLPRLYKHDKLSSFGRQLNIYGFTRQFPGRHFKDSGGRISDASVWAHPTLHRLSSTEDILSIKRRAAPKLFRTRRLANGQVVRTRAGPAVEAKFREVRESIAESRRRRGSLASIYPSKSGQQAQMPEDEGITRMSPRSRSSFDSSYVQERVASHEGHAIPPLPGLGLASPSGPGGLALSPQTPLFGSPAGLSSTVPLTPLTPMPTISTPALGASRARDSAGSLNDRKPRLADIQEGDEIEDIQTCGDFGSYTSFDQGSSTPVTVFSAHLNTANVGVQKPQRTMSTLMTSAYTDTQASHDGPPGQVDGTGIGYTKHTDSGTATVARTLQSCPASIHTTPVPARISLQQAGVDAWKLFFGQQPALIPQVSPSIEVDPLQPLTSAPPMITTEPVPDVIAGANGVSTDQYGSKGPFSTSSLHVLSPEPPVTGLQPSFPAGLQLPERSYSFPQYETVSPSYLAGRETTADFSPLFSNAVFHTNVPTHPGNHPSADTYARMPIDIQASTYALQTIDPRWISPGSSMVNTPAQTPAPMFTNPFDTQATGIVPGLSTSYEHQSVAMQQFSNALMNDSSSGRTTSTAATLGSTHLSVDPRMSIDETNVTDTDNHPIGQVQSDGTNQAGFSSSMMLRYGTQSYPPGQAGRRNHPPSNLFT